jgi:hypothetical protein
MATKIPERFRHLEERQGLVTVGHRTQREASLAVRRSVPTMDHAVRLVAAVRDQLGDRAWADPAGGTRVERLHRLAEHGDGWVAPTPIVELVHGRDGEITLATFVQGDEAAAAQPPGGASPAPAAARPQLRPRGPTMHSGTLTFAEGPSNYFLRYDEEGLFKDCVQTGGDIFTALHHGDERPPAIDPLARPPTLPPPSLLCRADLDPEGHPVEDFARKVIALDPAARAPALVRLPVPVPVGAGGVWQVGLLALRRALFAGSVSADAGFAVADGMEGTAIAWGSTLEDALRTWSGELFRAKPKPPLPPEPAPPPTDLHEPADGPRTFRDADGKVKGFSTGKVTLSFGGGDGEPPLPWPAAVPDKMPAAAIPIPPLPHRPESFARAGFTAWVRTVGQHGHVRHALARRDPDGTSFTLIGEGVLDLVDPDALDAELARAEVQERADDAEMAAQVDRPSMWEDPGAAVALVYYRCWDDDRRARIPLRRQLAAFLPSFDAGSLDADLVGWTVTRLSALR